MKRYRVTFEIEGTYYPSSAYAPEIWRNGLCYPLPKEATVEDITPWQPEVGKDAKAGVSIVDVLAIDGNEAWVKWPSGNRSSVSLKYLVKP